MKNIILKLISTTVAIFIVAHFFNGITVTNLNVALKVAVVLGLLQFFVKPIIVFLTIPITVLTLGLFLFVINSILILITDVFVEGFDINGFWNVLVFSWLLSFLQSYLFSFLRRENS